MKSLAERWQNLWDNFRGSPAKKPSRMIIPHDHVDHEKELDVTFKPNEHYFQVRVNEVFLAKEREWFKEYDPMVLMVSEFTYNKEEETVPYIVGPVMLKESVGQKIPAGMIFSDTRVVGLHPYRGGRLVLTVILCSVVRKDYLRDLLQIVESIAKILDFTGVSTYLKVADVVMDGLNLMLESDDTDPIIGLRDEIDPDAGEKFEPNYFALIDMDESKVKKDKFWVKENQLLYGDTLAEAYPFRKADFVLYSISQTSERKDLSTLPFYTLWERVVEEASKPTEANWESAKINMSSLYQAMMLSPDLTHNQGFELAEDYKNKMKQIHDKAVGMAELGPIEEEISEFKEKIRNKSLEILRM